MEDLILEMGVRGVVGGVVGAGLMVLGYLKNKANPNTKPKEAKFDLSKGALMIVSGFVMGLVSSTGVITEDNLVPLAQLVGLTYVTKQAVKTVRGAVQKVLS